uniref:Protein cordon-bleu-like n=1 Tax=Phallusia mammillata TaxID=59560 RepID=A0A6F9D945_9ASCI|nr:protein cordon-bleu-like [Phallusia mammillata]
MATIRSDDGSIYDEIGGSEDSESTYSDLDQEIMMEVILPDNSIHKITILASTPLSDLRTSVCSQFKLVPSQHVVEFVGAKSSVTKRKASLAIGRLDATMIKILTKKASNKPSPVPAAVANTSENTVRLIVKLPRLRQSIIRVNPDIPLQTIFLSVCEKLKLDAEKRSLVEFRHPQQPDIQLNPKHTLNDYNLREISLTDKRDLAPKPAVPIAHVTPKPAARKKKAPAPPPPSNGTAVRPPDTNGEVKPAPIKPAKRRHAPLPPQATHKVEEPEPEPVYAQVRKKKPEKQVEEKPEEEPHQESTEEELKDVTEETEDEISASLDATDELDKVLEEASIPSNSSTHSDEIDADDIKLEVNEFPERPPRIHKAVHKVEEHSDDITVDDVTKEEDVPAPAVRQQKSVEGKIKIYDVVDDEIKFDDSIVSNEETSSHHSDDVIAVDDVNHDETIHSENDEEPVVEKATDRLPQAEMDVKSIVESVSVVTSSEEETQIKDPEQESIVISPVSYVPVEPTPDDVEDLPPPPPSFLGSEDFDPLPPPPEDFSDNSTPSVEKLVISQTAVLPPPVANGTAHHEAIDTKLNTENNFDLRIAESLGISNVSIDEKQFPPPQKYKPVTAPKPAKSLASFIKDQNENEIKPAEHTSNENDSADAELLKLQKEIKRMKMRKSAKHNENNDQWKMMKESQRNSWHPGTKSFTFIPKKTNEVAHEDYQEAPIPVIELSNSGEIKPYSTGTTTDKKKEPPKVQPSTEAAPKPRSTLPSYYKKFLGANAFAASQTTQR